MSQFRENGITNVRTDGRTNGRTNGAEFIGLSRQSQESNNETIS